METRHQLENMEGTGRLVWPDHSLPARYDVSVVEYQEVSHGAAASPPRREIEAKIETDNQTLLAQANGRGDLVLQLEDGRQFPCVLHEAQGGTGWLVGTGELAPA